MTIKGEKKSATHRRVSRLSPRAALSALSARVLSSAAEGRRSVTSPAASASVQLCIDKNVSGSQVSTGLGGFSGRFCLFTFPAISSLSYKLFRVEDAIDLLDYMLVMIL